MTFYIGSQTAISEHVDDAFLPTSGPMSVRLLKLFDVTVITPLRTIRKIFGNQLWSTLV